VLGIDCVGTLKGKWYGRIPKEALKMVDGAGDGENCLQLKVAEGRNSWS